MIDQIKIINYRIFESFALKCNPDINILVGNNESGKSTILEAINLALTKRLNGRFLDQELSPHLFNKACVARYLAQLRAGQNPEPPSIVIELYLSDQPEVQELRGTNNSDNTNCPGVKVEVFFDEEYRDEYQKLLEDPTAIKMIPAEYYKVAWYSFANNGVTARSVKIRVSYIDATAIRLQSGADYYLNSIVNNGLDTKDRVGLAMAYRQLKEHFSAEPAIAGINSKLTQKKGAISDKDLALSMDLSHKANWETSLTPHLDDLPFQMIGKGEQNALKIMLALDRKAEGSHLILIEEPENHLSFSSMNVLIQKIAEKCAGKQIFATTHSAYVLNKLGIDKLVLLHGGTAAFLNTLPVETREYFKRLSGYDTLRMILARRTILVEGPSDELIVQKAYLIRHGRLPIQDGVDVINVRGLSFARFLDIAKELNLRTSVVTDNDGDYARKVTAKYAPYASCGTITIHASNDNELHTLEPNIVECNEVSLLNEVLGKTYAKDDLVRYMEGNKTECALRLFETQKNIRMPEYVWDAVAEK